MPTPVGRTLQRASEILGGEEVLAAKLGVTPDDIRAWILGERTPPYAIYLAALDIVARGA